MGPWLGTTTIVTTKKRIRILAIASSGGHWLQLRRLAPAFPAGTTWVSTDPGHRESVKPDPFRFVPDANRWNKIALMWSALRILLVAIRCRPTHVVTTGAAPGWFMIVFTRMLGARTLWIDSIANGEELSLSGDKARRWATEVWTQWPEIVEQASASGVEVTHHGAVL